MAQINVTINGHSFRMGCEDGQQGHLLQLCEEVNGHIEQFKEMFGEVGDMRLLAMTAILLADERFELREKLVAASGSANAHQSEKATVEGQHAADLEEHAVQLEATASRLETIANQFKQI